MNKRLLRHHKPLLNQLNSPFAAGLRRDNGRVHLLNLISARPDLIGRHLSKYRPVPETGCWEWLGALSSGQSKAGHALGERYGVVSIRIGSKSTKVQAHRLANFDGYWVRVTLKGERDLETDPIAVEHQHDPVDAKAQAKRITDMCV